MGVLYGLFILIVVCVISVVSLGKGILFHTKVITEAKKFNKTEYTLEVCSKYNVFKRPEERYVRKK